MASGAVSFRSQVCENVGEVKSKISALQQAMKAAGAQTLGEYSAGLAPHTLEVRRPWTGRAMFQKEFDFIWEEQVQHHAAVMSPELREKIAHLLSLAADRETGQIDWALQVGAGVTARTVGNYGAQRFRMLQKVNDLLVVDPRTQDTSSLSYEQPAKLLQMLDDKGSQSLIALWRKPEFEGKTFNLEAGGGKEGGEKNIPGNRTRASMLKVFGSRWEDFSEGKRNNVIDTWRKSESDDKLRADAAYWEASTKTLIRESPQSDDCSLSLKAISRIMPSTEEGMPLNRGAITAARRGKERGPYTAAKLALQRIVVYAEAHFAGKVNRDSDVC